MNPDLERLQSYPPTLGGEALRVAISQWLQRRYALEAVDPQSEVIPVNGSREALFAFAQAVIDATRSDPVVVCPNPFSDEYYSEIYFDEARPPLVNASRPPGASAALSNPCD
ncbi:MAG: hypothetical protein HYU76_12845 [Betaproteobacteria bacterium]|nr:hypothetical protein [Betaproteobacteria bacterium]